MELKAFYKRPGVYIARYGVDWFIVENAKVNKLLVTQNTKDMTPLPKNTEEYNMVKDAIMGH